jgi:hypothetical protein
MTTLSEPTGTPLTEDIVIRVGRDKAAIAALTQKGLDWIAEYMTEPSPVHIEVEHVEEIADIMKQRGLIVLVR